MWCVWGMGVEGKLCPTPSRLCGRGGSGGRRGGYQDQGEGSGVPGVWKDVVVLQHGSSPEELQGVGPRRGAGPSRGPIGLSFMIEEEVEDEKL